MSKYLSVNNEEIDMGVIEIAVAGSWAFACACAVSKNVASTGFYISFAGAAVITAVAIFLH